MGVGLHQIEQYLLQQMVFIRRFLTGDLIGAVFAIGGISPWRYWRRGLTGRTPGAGVCLGLVKPSAWIDINRSAPC